MTIGISPKYTFNYEGLTFNIYHANKGEGLPRHEHKYSHATVCHAGSCLVSVKDKKLVLTKETQAINLLGNKWHEIEALEDGTVFVNIFVQDKY